MLAFVYAVDGVVLVVFNSGVFGGFFVVVLNVFWVEDVAVASLFLFCRCVALLVFNLVIVVATIVTVDLYIFNSLFFQFF